MATLASIRPKHCDGPSRGEAKGREVSSGGGGTPPPLASWVTCVIRTKLIGNCWDYPLAWPLPKYTQSPTRTKLLIAVNMHQNVQI